MKRISALAAAAAVLLAACADAGNDAFAPSLDPAAGGVAGLTEVTSPADAGVGSLRAAVEAANIDPAVTRIRITAALGPVALESPLVYSGAQPLTIDGNGVVLDGSGLPAAAPHLDAAFVSNGGGDLTIRELGVESSTGVGILVDVPAGRGETIVIELDRVTVTGSRLHGVLVNDQVDYFAEPFTRADGGSDASLLVRLSASTITGNGFAGLDYDGVRVNEGGAGSLDFRVTQSLVQGNGADGIELDERSAGDAIFSVEHTRILENGFFSSEDWDDGIDVDELGTGHLIGSFVQAVASGNAEQGVDLNENNEGDLRVTMTGVTAEDNSEEGVEFEEDDDFEDFPDESWGGDLDAVLVAVTTNRNGANDGDAGLKVREKFAGNLTARITRAYSADNAIAGIEVREGQGGSMDAEVVNATALRNDGAGLRLRGNGIARVRALTGEGNTDGNLEIESGIVIIE